MHEWLMHQWINAQNKRLRSHRILRSPDQEGGRNERFNLLRSLLPPEGSLFADVGSGPDGGIGKYVVKRGVKGEWVCLDPLIDRIQCVGHIHPIKAVAEKLPVVAERFDTVFCINALDHMINPTQALVEMRRVIKTDGKLALMVHTVSGADLILHRISSLTKIYFKGLLLLGLRALIQGINKFSQLLRLSTIHSIFGDSDLHPHYFQYSRLTSMLKEAGLNLERAGMRRSSFKIELYIVANRKTGMEEVK